MAVAGIAQPENFFSMLEQMGLNLQEKIGLADHHDFGHFDNNVDGQFQILCTDKDADKLWSRDSDAIAVTLIQEADRDFYEALDTKISKLLANR
jgi:tetraacyldisaccharide 4'-kinase